MRQPCLDYLPNSSLPYIESLLRSHPIPVYLTPARRSKQGDFRPGPPPRITLNVSLNPYALLLTLVHELVHYVVYKKYKATVKPHGPAWKRSFTDLMAPLLTEAAFPAVILSPLKRHMRDPRATFHADSELLLALRRSDPDFKEGYCIQNQPAGSCFRYGGRVFRIGEKRRMRYLCTEVLGGRHFAFHPLTQIQPCDM